MINVAVTLSANALSLNGAALYVMRFLNNESKYQENDIKITICDSKRAFQNVNDYVKTREYSKKQKIKQFLKKTTIGSCLFMFMRLKKHANEIYKLHEDELKLADVFIANDVQSAHLLKKKFPKKPVIFIMHNSGDLFHMDYVNYPKLNKKIIRYVLEKFAYFVYEKVEKIVFVSETSRQTFIMKFNEFEKKTYFMPQCIEDTDYQIKCNTEQLDLICVGTICHRKNQISILKALKKILDNDSRKKISLSFVGDGEEYQKCIDYVQESKMNNVVFYGAQRDVSRYLNKANCFIFPSLDEGLPIVAIEAMRAGLPLILTDVGGCKELINGNGILLDSGYVDNIKKGIEYIYERMNSIDVMSKKSRNLYEEFYHIDYMVGHYSELIKELI